MPGKKIQGGSRPPLPYRSGHTSAASIVAIMGLVIAGAFVTSGSVVPVDPNGPGGPPTLEPYYDPEDYPKQNIVPPTGGFGYKDNNLQLKTFNVDACAQNTALIFLVDTSGSMANDNKMNNLKSAMRYFTSRMGGKSVIGIYTFSKDIDEAVPINLYKDVRKDVDDAINSFPTDGWTRTKDGMALVYERIKEMIDDDVYPGYKYNLIVLTDGVPEIPPPQPAGECIFQTPDPNLAPAQRCFARSQDPRAPVNIPNDIKAMGVSIFTINIYSTTKESDVRMFPYLEALLKEISSPDIKEHYFTTIHANNLQSILNTISNAICYEEFTGKKKPL